jgi:outer membrane lipoprotein-sorting protein
MMKPKLPVLVFFSLLPLAACAQTADEIVAKSLAARGGIEKIKAVQSQRISGTISFGPGAEGPFVIELKRPLKLHMEVTLGGQKLVRVYDGKSTGWTVNPFAEDRSPQPMAAEELKNIDDEADFDGPLVDYKAKGSQIELAGKDEVAGKAVYKIKLTRKTAEARIYYIDASTFDVLKWDGTTRIEDNDVPVENFLRNYRDVNGLRFPFEIDSDSPGSPQERKITVEKIELDLKIEESRFGKPPAAPAPAAAPSSQEK